MNDDENSPLVGLTQEQIDAIDDKLEERGFSTEEQLYEDAIKKEGDRLVFFSLAANIAEDRYSGGSAGARWALLIAIRHGLEAAERFVGQIMHLEN